MSRIGKYEITGEFSTENAGLSRWTFCTWEGREYFIKELLEPVYPVRAEELSLALVERKRKACEKFFGRQSFFYHRLADCRTGNNVITEDFFREGSRYYIVTEKVHSVGTDPKIAAALDDERKMVLTKALLYSVAGLQREQIVHGDLKADNVLLKRTTDGCLTGKIIDFDSGFLEGNCPEEVQGDFVYLAPETFLRLQGENILLTGKIDMFALGILIHQYWTGEMPSFSGEYQYVFEAVLNSGELTLNAGIPRNLRELLASMLRLNPVERPTAAEALGMLKGTAGLKSTMAGFHVPKELD